MGDIKKTLTLERRKKVLEKTANHDLIVVVASLFMILFFIKVATLDTFFRDVLRIIALFFVFIFTTSRYSRHKKTIKCINEELKKTNMQNAEDAKKRLRNRM